VPPPPPPPPAPPPPPPVITRPDWISRPDGSEFARYYPSRAQEDGVSGRATLSCTVTTRGTLTNCQVVSESPAGAGFGRASQQIANRFRMRPQTVNGQPVEASTRFPIVWQLGE
jgi:protein TonB